MIGRVPPSPADPFVEKDSFCMRRAIYAHKITISSLPEIEQSFKKYLTDLCIDDKAPQTALKITGCTIKERKLTVATHNTWMRTGEETMVSLNISEHDGSISCAGSLEILDYSLHKLNMLIFKVVYRVQINQQDSGKGGVSSTRTQDFVLGWGFHLPYVSDKGNFLESEEPINLQTGPAITITGDIVWDKSQGSPES